MRLIIMTVVAAYVAAADRQPQPMQCGLFKQMFAQFGGSVANPAVHYTDTLEFRVTDLGILPLWGYIALTLTAKGELIMTYDYADEDGGNYGEDEIKVVLVEKDGGTLAIYDSTRKELIGEGKLNLDDTSIYLDFKWELELDWRDFGEVEVLLKKNDRGKLTLSIDAPGTDYNALADLDSTIAQWIERHGRRLGTEWIERHRASIKEFGLTLPRFEDF